MVPPRPVCWSLWPQMSHACSSAACVWLCTDLVEVVPPLHLRATDGQKAFGPQEVSIIAHDGQILAFLDLLLWSVEKDVPWNRRLFHKYQLHPRTRASGVTKTHLNEMVHN